MVSYKYRETFGKRAYNKKVSSQRTKFGTPLVSLIVVFLPLISSLIFTLIYVFVVLSSLKPVFPADPLYIPETLIFKKEKEIPYRIVIPKISVDRLIKQAVIQNGTWETFDDFVSYGLGSAPPRDQKGSTVMFAHARTGLFSRLDELLEGDSIYILEKNNWYLYKVLKKIYVLPTETDFLKDNYGRSLILFTCYGPLDEKRVVIISGYVNEEGI